MPTVVIVLVSIRNPSELPPRLYRCIISGNVTSPLPANLSFKWRKTSMPPNFENQDAEKLEKESRISIEKVRKLVVEHEGTKLQDDEPPLLRSETGG
jgi:hypothetical protein